MRTNLADATVAHSSVDALIMRKHEGGGREDAMLNLPIPPLETASGGEVNHDFVPCGEGAEDCASAEKTGSPWRSRVGVHPPTEMLPADVREASTPSAKDAHHIGEGVVTQHDIIAVADPGTGVVSGWHWEPQDFAVLRPV
jgi:hypothetical protein